MHFNIYNTVALAVAALALTACALLAPVISARDQPTARSANFSAPASASGSNSTVAHSSPAARRVARRDVEGAQNARSATKQAALGDIAGLKTALDSRVDLVPAAGEHKKYILVKKKPKMKKIKMDVYEPKMKYKKIKMKVPIKKMKKKKVKGYLVKKEHEHY